MPGLSVGVQIASLRQPLKKALQTAASIGADAVEIDARTDLRPSDLSGTALRQIRKMLNDLNLRVVAVRFQTRRGYDCPDELDRRVTATKEAMKMAADLGASVVVNQIGNIPEDINSPGHEMLRDVLGDFGRYSQHIGCFLGCETGSEPLSYMAKLIDSLPEGSLGVTLNPGNLIYNGFDLSDLRTVAAHVMLVHAKDAVHDRAQGRGTEVPLGRGLAEFPEIAATLEEHRFRSSFVIQKDNLRDPIHDLTIAIEFLRNL